MQADKNKTAQLLKTARGQLDGILKMVEEDRYCIDVYNQLMATQSILKKAGREVMRAHMAHCVKQAFERGNEEEKIDEILNILDKLSK